MAKLELSSDLVPDDLKMSEPLPSGIARAYVINHVREQMIQEKPHRNNKSHLKQTKSALKYIATTDACLNPPQAIALDIPSSTADITKVNVNATATTITTAYSSSTVGANGSTDVSVSASASTAASAASNPRKSLVPIDRGQDEPSVSEYISDERQGQDLGPGLLPRRLAHKLLRGKGRSKRSWYDCCEYRGSICSDKQESTTLSVNYPRPKGHGLVTAQSY